MSAPRQLVSVILVLSGMMTKIMHTAMRASLREINQIMQQFSGNAGAPEQHTEIMANLTAGSTVACRPDHPSPTARHGPP